jgi:hypothetical protein
MTREVAADFELYKSHLREIAGCAHLLESPSFEASLKRVHRHFLALLTLALELTDFDGDCRAHFEADFGDDGIAYFREVVSDIGQASHCFANGAYKAALVTMRSSIESYCKAFSAQHDHSILTQKSVPEVFARAKASPFFTAPSGKHYLDVLLTVYDELNLYVHTVTDAQMFNVLHLGVYPQFDPARAAEFERIYVKITNAYVAAVVITLKSEMFKVHYKNRDNILSALSPKQIQAFNAPRD